MGKGRLIFLSPKSWEVEMGAGSKKNQNTVLSVQKGPPEWAEVADPCQLPTSVEKGSLVPLTWCSGSSAQKTKLVSLLDLHLTGPVPLPFGAGEGRDGRPHCFLPPLQETSCLRRWLFPPTESDCSLSLTRMVNKLKGDINCHQALGA